MESLQLIRVLSLIFLGFGSLRFLESLQAEKVCLLDKRSINTGIGGDRGGSGNPERSSDVEDEKGKERNVFTVPYSNVPGFYISFSSIPYSEKTGTGNGDSHSKDENLGNGENQLLQNDLLKEIQDELTGIAQRSLNLWQQVAVLAKGIQQTTNDLIDQKSDEASNSESIQPQANDVKTPSKDSQKRKSVNRSNSDRLGERPTKFRVRDYK